MSAENRLLRQYVRQKTLVNDTPIGHPHLKARQARLSETEARIERRLLELKDRQKKVKTRIDEIKKRQEINSDTVL